MSDRLTSAQLQKLVAEMQRLQTRQQDELDATQVQEILQELNLSPELLPDAMVQLRRREALEVQNCQRRWIIGGAIAAIVIVVSGSIAFLQHKQQVFNQIGVQADQVLLQSDPSRPVNTVSRPANLEYQTTLTQAPVGQTLSLQCDWLDPTGAVVKQNRYATKVITTDVWQTRCRYDLGVNATPGTWKVRLLRGDRELSTATFEVR